MSHHARRPKRTWLGLRVVVALAAISTLVATGVGWWGKGELTNGITVSDALGTDAPKSIDGATNILLIGLDSRKDQQGNDLPQPILDQLHAGDGQEGGYNTNTLILVHIPAGGGKITAFSIPRDDYVAVTGIPDNDHIKIKEAYGLKKAATEESLRVQGITDQATIESRGREAGRAETLQTVRSLVGVPIDHFAEVNLAGFYDLASSLGGVQVCLNHAVHDDYSGANFPAGEQTLNGAQALAFVRQRHGLDNGDLDRTHRQQAFLVSVAKQMQSAGTFTDLGKLQGLVDVARRDVVLSSGWDIVDFASRVGATAATNVEFQTLPVKRYDVIDGQDVNIIDPAAIKAQVHAAFGSPDASTATSAKRLPTSTIDVVNSGAPTGLAAAVSKALGDLGYRHGAVGNATFADGSASTVEYGPGAGDDADDVASQLGGLPIASDSRLAAGHIRVVLGSGFDAADVPHADANVPAGTAPNPTPDHGPPVDGDAIPCVN